MLEPLIIFTHIPKTAGSTLAHVLGRQYDASEIFQVTQAVAEKWTQPKLMQRLESKVKLLTGHWGYGLHRFTERPCRYFTILRDPVERLISLYYYLQRDREHYLHAQLASGEMSFIDLINLEANAAARQLAGPCPAEEVADRARRNLTTDYEVCGITEQFDETMLCLEDTFGWRIPSYREKNVTSKRPGRDAIPAEVLAAIRDMNPIDFELYELAKRLLHERIGEPTAEFTERLHRLRARVERKRRLYNAASCVFEGTRKLWTPLEQLVR